jgi:hypothetical protein
MISSINCTPIYLNEEFLREKYVKERLSTTQISRLTFSAKHLKQAGVRVRPYHEAIEGRSGQVPYGKRIKNGRMVDCKSELRLIEKMRDLRDKKYSYWKIAQLLNDWGVSTKNGGTRWHPTTVMKILKASP